ncbi:MAG TPA: LemA family protein [Candidatus Scatovivens faecipullorum]|nr:LemA family protein [Candidatus Scatovivens faecipullorum]
MYILAILLILILIFIMIEFNTFIRLRNKIKHSKSGIEVYLNQRFDLIPNLVECVKGYTKYEEQTLSKITNLRSQYNNAKNKDLKLGEELNNEFNNLLAVGESNPDLKASEQFLNLQRSLEKMESQLQAARRIYNGDVTLYNTTISTFPNNFFAGIFGFKEEDLFQIEEYKKENVKPNWR